MRPYSVEPPAPGVYHDVDADVYRSWDAVSASQLKALAKSELHYAHYMSGGVVQTPSMLLGSATHCALLEPEQFPRRYGCKDARGQKSTADGPQLLTPGDWDKCLGMRDAVLADPVASGVLAACPQREVSLVWHGPFGWTCKARLDAMGDRLIGDIKTCQDATLHGVQSQLAAYGNHIQAAHYCEGYEAVFGSRPAFVFLCVESSPPHTPGTYEIGGDSVAMAASDRMQLLRKLDMMADSPTAPAGYTSEIATVELPRWYRGLSA